MQPFLTNVELSALSKQTISSAVKTLEETTILVFDKKKKVSPKVKKVSYSCSKFLNRLRATVTKQCSSKETINKSLKSFKRQIESDFI
jgi:phage-related minor tail protein